MIRIRRFSFPDLKAVREIERISFPHHQASSENYYQNLYQTYPQGFIIAQQGEKIVGYAISQIRNRVPAKRVGEIISIAVAPDWRRKGNGRQLMKFLLNDFQKEKIKLVSLHVRENNKVAILFFDKLGFKITKKIKNYYRNDDKAFLMEKILGI